jgi:hypothetical protein
MLYGSCLKCGGSFCCFSFFWLSGDVHKERCRDSEERNSKALMCKCGWGVCCCGHHPQLDGCPICKICLLARCPPCWSMTRMGFNSMACELTQLEAAGLISEC